MKRILLALLAALALCLPAAAADSSNISSTDDGTTYSLTASTLEPSTDYTVSVKYTDLTLKQAGASRYVCNTGVSGYASDESGVFNFSTSNSRISCGFPAGDHVTVVAWLHFGFYFNASPVLLGDGQPARTTLELNP